MASSQALLLLGFLAAAAAAPWPSSAPLCSTECPVAGSPKLAYTPQKTYVYSYSGTSRVQLQDVEDAKADSQWSTQVELSWLSPCDMAISLKNPSIGGSSGSPDARFLERYPMVVAVIDGRVQQACTHPEDDVWAINLKKGIASAFQNVLPSISSINSGLNFTETDITGNCSTRYYVENQGENVIVRKQKNLRYCQDRYVNRAETPKAWPKSPLPLEESYSECEQEISNGIYTSVTCKDKYIIRPAYGSYKYIEATQQATLRYQSKSDEVPPPVSNIRGPMEINSLRYTQKTLKKDSSMTAKLDEALKQVCEKTKTVAEEDAAAEVAKALHYLRRVPENEIPRTLQKIRSGELCSQKQKLESLFLDAVAFVNEPGAVKVMVEELVSGRATAGRSALYTAAFYLMPRPCIHSVQALSPLFENAQRFPRTVVAAATMVNTFCRQNPKDCQEESAVKQLAQTLSSKAGELCSQTGQEKAREEALALFKALGNMGVMTSEIASPVIQCIEKESAERSVRAAATQAFRNAQCSPQFQAARKQLVNIALNPIQDTEVRIGSYLAAIKCVDSEDLNRISDEMTIEQNTQVRGFILSHLLNVQESGAPYKENLKYLLNSTILPSNFTSDLRKYSRNIDVSYYLPTFGFGAGVDSNVIYAPGSFLPRSVNLNFTAALGATPVNMGEIGARIEGLEPLLEELAGPEGYLRRTPTSQIFQDISSSLSEKMSKIGERLESAFRQRRSIDFSTLQHLFDKLYGDRRHQKPKADLYARINNQEIAFASLAGDLKNINIDRLIDTFFDNIDELIDRASNLNTDTLRTAQVYLDYYIPTMQGMPIKMKLEATAVVGLKLETRPSPSTLKFTPSLSSQMNGFVGFDYYIEEFGLKTKNSLASSSGVSINAKNAGGHAYELEVVLPEKMEIINVKSTAYLMKSQRGQPERKINPSSVQPARVQKQSCVRSLEQSFGLKICYDVNIPDIFRSHGLPLGPPSTVKLLLEKSDPSMKGYRVIANVHNISGRKEIKLQVSTPGSSTPRAANAEFSYANEGDSRKYALVMESQISGGFKIEVRNKWTQSEKSLEANAYFSRARQYTSDAQVLKAMCRLIDDGQQVKFDSVMQTKGAARNYLEVQNEVGVDFRYTPEARIPVPEKLRKLEFVVATQRSHLVAYIRSSSDSQYTSVFKFGRKGAEAVDFKANHKVEGSSYRDLTAETDIYGKIGETQYKSQFAVYYNQEKTGIIFDINRQGDSAQIMKYEALFIRSGENYRLKYQFAIPAYMKPMLFELSAAHEGSSRYQMKAISKHGESTIFKAVGPLTIHGSSKQINFQTQLEVNLLNSAPYTVKSTISYAQKKQLLAFELESQQGRILASEFKMVTSDEQETNIAFEVNIPSMIKKKLIVLVSGKALHLTIDDVLLPMSSSPMKLRGYIDLDYESKQGKCNLVWDTVHSQNNKLSAEVAIERSSTLQHSTISGEWTFMESRYEFKTELNLADPRTWFTGRNQASIQIKAPSRGSYHLVCEVQNELPTASPSAEVKVSLKTPESREYKLDTEATLQYLEGPYSLKVSTKSDFTSPQGRQSHYEIEYQHEKSERQRSAYLQVHITSPSLEQPLQTKFTLDNQQGRYGAQWNVEMGSPANAARYELVLSPEGGVQTFLAELKLQQVKKVLSSVERLASSSSSPSPSSSYVSAEAHRSGASYLIHYEKPSSTSHSLKIHSPSRRMESEYKKSPTEFLIKFHPHKGVSEEKYELYAKRSHQVSWFAGTSKFEGGMSHPSMKKDIKIEAQYTRNERTVSGSVELDIFPNSADKITGKIESQIISRNTVIVEAQLSGKALKSNPKVTIRAAYGLEVIGFDFKLQKAPSSPSSLAISGRVDMSSGRNAASSFIIKTGSQTTLDISGSFRTHQSPYCYGILFESKAQSSVIGKYDVSAELCRPLFIKALVMKSGSETLYITKLGVQNQRNVEASIAEVDPATREERMMGMARAKLTLPSVLVFEGKYESEKLGNVKESVQEKWSQLMSAAGSKMDEIVSEVVREGGSAPSSQMRRMWEEIKEEASRIVRDLEYDGIIPSSERWQKVVRSDIVQGFIGGYSRLWSKYSQLKRDLNSKVSNAFRNVESEFDDVAQIIRKAVMGTAQGLQNGEVPEGLQNLWRQFQETSIYRTYQRELDALFSEYPEAYEGFKQIVQKMKETLANDFRKQSQNLMNFHKPRQIVHWIVSRLNPDRLAFIGVNKVVKAIIETALIIPVQAEDNYVQLRLPVRRPVYSIPEALYYSSMNPFPVVDTTVWAFDALMPIPMDDIMWAYYSLIPRRARYLLPPYNSTALVVDGTEILTFDGAVIRAPRSSCKVLLAQHKSDSLIMENPPSAPLPQYTLKASGVTVQVKPDFTITMNGRPVSGPEQTEGKVTVYKKREEFEVYSPYMILHVYEKSHTLAIEASGWAYGQMAGLLGAFDGEMSTDTITSTGSRPSSLQDLVKSWQEDQSCQTPSISPESPLLTKASQMIQCRALFAVRSRCNPVVRQEPFMRMCYASKSACHVARAYGAICATKGVKDVFPLGC